MTRHLSKDTQLCMSLAARPGNFGTRFHNYLYDALDLDYLYKAFTTHDIVAAIGGVRALGVRGCAISMPFKEAVIPLMDEMDASAAGIGSVNTIVNSAGWLKAYNTDYIAIAQLLRQYALDPTLTFALHGSGGMAKAVACALKDAGFSRGYIVAKNADSGQQLAQLYGYRWCQTLPPEASVDLLINATPVGMLGSEFASACSFSLERIAQACAIFEVVAQPIETPLVQAARAAGKTVITGAEVFAIQAVEQFVLYTGIRPEHALFLQAAAYARGE
ncbi:shikimate 5-dehydrogenase [Edwardsiella hoshinae]|uniref:Shikimate 5-dehydrogenase-like protein HI_0607 n=1 Tax=Edwardsiella hoshinae TaxID=93378 RepID=A0A376D8V4_9GAMM|nr:shikimate 5-dehydrogenase [Edwardsiella hoshinae]QPR28240.1 shikimate 5-dehydrogenase [Edwardsiella hoshinae]STC84265.1 Shikimate 5-dehydrogenase-like protein HI_0607 [Edwardsiella hoshinae]